MWIFTFLVFLYLPLATIDKTDRLDIMAGNEDPVNAAVFAIFLLFWSIANGWLVYQCVLNPTNAVARFLSAKFFQPFSRLSFCIYLCHLMTVWYNGYQTRTTISFANMTELVSLSQSVILHYLIICITFHYSTK